MQLKTMPEVPQYWTVALREGYVHLLIICHLAFEIRDSA